MKKYIIECLSSQGVYSINTHYLNSEGLRVSNNYSAQIFVSKEEATRFLFKISQERKQNDFNGMFKIVEVHIY